MNKKRKWDLPIMLGCLISNWVLYLLKYRWPRVGYGLVILILSATSVGQNNTLSPAVYRQLQQVEKLLAETQYDNAFKKLEKLQARYHKRQNTDSAMIWQVSGHVLAAKGQYTEAIAADEQALATNTLSQTLTEPLLQNLGQLYIITGRSKEGIRILKNWLNTAEHSQQHAPLYALLAQAHAQQNAFPKAIKAIGKALSLNRDTKSVNSLAWRRAEIAYLLSAERYKAAAKALEKLVSLQPEDRTLWQQWWSTELMAGNSSNALSILQLANEKHLLSDAEDYHRLSDLYLQEKMPFEAAQTLQTALRDKVLQETAQLWIRTAQLYYQARDHGGTSLALMTANRLATSATEARQIANLAATINQWTTVKEATEHQIKLISKTKEDSTQVLNTRDTPHRHLPQAQYLLAIAHIKLNKPEAAKPLLVTLQKNKKYGASARQWLDQLTETP